MAHDLISRRDEVMDVAWKALDAAWPERKGDEFVRTMRWAVGQIEQIAVEMRRKSVSRVEQCRTYRHLGSMYSDLEPALGKPMLLKAKEAYAAAEALLEGESDEMERAKLRFNFANTLRLIDADNLEYLNAARERLVAARAYFVGSAPQFLQQVDAALTSVDALLSIAPIANAVRQNTEEMAALQQERSAGGDVTKLAGKVREVMKRGGGVVGVAARVQAVMDTLPPELRQGEKFTQVQEQMQAVRERLLGGESLSPEDERAFAALRERVKSEASGTLGAGRAAWANDVLGDFERILARADRSIEDGLGNAQSMRDLIASQLEKAHYPSYGIERPPSGSRAADLIEQSWQLRRYLLEEMNRPEKGEQESRECLELSIRASAVDRRIYEARADDAAAMAVKVEELHPLALRVRNFSARMQAMPVSPIWRSAAVPVDTNAAFCAGPAAAKNLIAAACRRSGLQVMPEPRDDGHADARWKQLQKAFVTVFDFRVEPGPDLAAVAYELGIALTLGRPAVVLVAERQTVPFDVEIRPVVCFGGPDDVDALVAAIDSAIVWTFPKPDTNTSDATLEHVMSRYLRPHPDASVDQTLKVLQELRQDPDPLAVSRCVAKLFDYLDGGKTMLIHPRWPLVYPDEKNKRLFHVMPFRPGWAKEVTGVARKTSEAAGVAYVRGDEVEEPNVIRSIWEEIARATHVLVDLSGFNANVALELGIAHTLGRKVLIVGQEDTVDHLFPSVRKLRVHTYTTRQLRQTFGKAVESFVRS